MTISRSNSLCNKGINNLYFITFLKFDIRVHVQVIFLNEFIQVFHQNRLQLSGLIEFLPIILAVDTFLLNVHYIDILGAIHSTL